MTLTERRNEWEQYTLDNGGRVISSAITLDGEYVQAYSVTLDVNGVYSLHRYFGLKSDVNCSIDLSTKETDLVIKKMMWWINIEHKNR